MGEIGDAGMDIHDPEHDTTVVASDLAAAPSNPSRNAPLGRNPLESQVILASVS